MSTDPWETKSKNLKWAISARSRCQELILRLCDFGKYHHSLAIDPRNDVFSLLQGAGFSLWRAAFLVDMTNRTWEKTLEDGHLLLEEVLVTNSINFSAKRRMSEWMGGYYMNNARLRLDEAQRKLGQLRPDDNTKAVVRALEQIRTLDRGGIVFSNPEESWMILCDALESLFQELTRPMSR